MTLYAGEEETLAQEHRMINPVVNPVPQTDHWVITTVLYDPMLPRAPGDYFTYNQRE